MVCHKEWLLIGVSVYALNYQCTEIQGFNKDLFWVLIASKNLSCPVGKLSPGVPFRASRHDQEPMRRSEYSSRDPNRGQGGEGKSSN